MSPYIERSKDKLMKYNYDEWRKTHRERRSVPIACVKFQDNFWGWVSRARERALAAGGHKPFDRRVSQFGRLRELF